MTLKNFTDVTVYHGKVSITCIAFYKDTKKYYSFRTYIYRQDWDRNIFDDYILSLEVKTIGIFNDEMLIDVIEWI